MSEALGTLHLTHPADPAPPSGRVYEFTVNGEPRPKGSMRAFAHKSTGRLIVTSMAKGLKPWGKAIATTGRELGPGPWFEAGVPVRVGLTFRMLRPKSVTVGRRLHPSVTPDLDKLARAALDPLKGLAYVDDAQVCEVHARKVYATSPAAVGVVVTVEAL